MGRFSRLFWFDQAWKCELGLTPKINAGPNKEVKPKFNDVGPIQFSHLPLCTMSDNVRYRLPIYFSLKRQFIDFFMTFIQIEVTPYR